MADGEDLVVGNTVATTLTHFVATRDTTGTLRLYVNGALAGSQGFATGDIAAWVAYPLNVGNVPNMDRGWLGEYHLVAIYSRALSAAQIAQNFAAGADP
jgi:hypothetical protein